MLGTPRFVWKYCQVAEFVCGVPYMSDLSGWTRSLQSSTPPVTIHPSRAPASGVAVSIISPPKIRRAVARPHCCHMGWTAGSFPCTDVVSSTRRSARGWKHGVTDGMQYAICNGTQGMKTEAAWIHDGQGPLSATAARPWQGWRDCWWWDDSDVEAAAFDTPSTVRYCMYLVQYSSTARRAITDRKYPSMRLGISEELTT
jgi:hypothetical protein